MFLGIKCYVKCEWFMNKPLSKNLQNIDGNKIVKFGVCKCCRSGRKNLSLAFNPPVTLKSDNTFYPLGSI